MRVKCLENRRLNSLFGRDELGRDLLARLFWGARISLIVGLVATLVSLVIGVSYGAISGYVGGWVDDLMMRIVDVLYSIPFIFVVIFLVTILGEDPSKRAGSGGDRSHHDLLFRRRRDLLADDGPRGPRPGHVAQERTVRRSGPHDRRRAAAIIFRHLVPNVLSVVIVYLTLTIPQVMLFEAFLSFLGLGVQAPDVSWGLLANEGIRVITPVKIYWWLVVFPGLALGTTLFALNFLGDGCATLWTRD